jgi:hypothetical protein
VNTNKIFKFIPTSQSKVLGNDVITPVKAASVIPEWYKDLAGYRGGTSHNLEHLNPINDRGSDGSDVSTKLCLPFMDAMTSGYMYLLEEDLNVSIDENGKPSLSWDKHSNLMDIRSRVDMSIPQDCHPIHFGVKMSWYWQTPDGYSTLITHPLNRPELPFYVPSGVVDSDIWGLPVFVPFFIKRNFIGKIERGTPVFQMLPIKRENWDMEIDSSEGSILKHKIREEKRRSHITAHYKKTTWQKKGY